LLSQWVSAFPAELDIAFAKVTKGENTAGCLIVWEYAVKNVYCQYDLMFSKKRKKSVSIEHSFWMDGSIQLTRYTETFSLINAIRKWLKILYPNLKIARNTPQRLGQLITGLKNESRSKIIFETQKRDIYHIEIHNNKNNPYAKTQPKKQFSWLVHTAIAKKSPLQKRSYAQIIAEKKLAVTEKLIVSEKKLTLTEDIPKEHKVQSIFIADFEIAFAKLANNKNTAGCLIVWEKYVVSSKKHIYCRYELNKIRDFLTDPKYGINLLNVFVFHSKDHVDFQSEIKYWLTSKYPHLTLDLNNQYISKLENIISNPSMIFNSIHFAGKKRDIYRLSIQSNKNNPYKHHSDKQLAWLVHTTIAQKLTQPQNKVQVKKDIQLDIQPTKKEFKTEEHSHTLIVIISWVRDLIILIVCV
ncbi:MAG: hypothetical protein KAH77_10255, partial [Thiomargarita sp.]|nr:hypothetical protein [Thiomargarita sp.]